MKKQRTDKNKGFTLVEMVIVVAIFAILLGILIPSLNPILGYRANRVANSIGAALDETRTQAMNRLVGEMKLSYTSDGYYISYYLDRGKSGNKSNVKQDQPEKIAPLGTRIIYTTDDGAEHEMNEGDSIVLTYDRATGGFLPLQENVWMQKEILSVLDQGEDIPLTRKGSYCTQITVRGGKRYRTIRLNITTGKYEVTSGRIS